MTDSQVSEKTTTGKPKEMQIYRTEARSRHWLGSAYVGNSDAFKKPLILAIFCLVTLLLLTTTLSFGKRVSVPGALLPSSGMVAVASPQIAVVDQILVEEGGEIEANAPLIRLKTDRSVAHGSTAQIQQESIGRRKAIANSEYTLALLRTDAAKALLTVRSGLIHAEIEQLFDEIKLNEDRESGAELGVQRYKRLLNDGFISEIQLQQKQDEKLEQRGRAQSSRRALLAAKRDLSTLESELAGIDTSRKEAELSHRRTLELLDQELVDLRGRAEIVLHAPVAARVTTISVARGQTVSSNASLITLAPTNSANSSASLELVCELFVSSREIGSIKVGQAVKIRYAAFPYRRYGTHGGLISKISKTPMNSNDILVSQALQRPPTPGDPIYKITVALESQTFDRTELKPGMALEALVEIDRRPLWRWLILDT